MELRGNKGMDVIGAGFGEWRRLVIGVARAAPRIYQEKRARKGPCSFYVE